MTKREIAEAHRYAEMIREKDKARIQQEQPEPSNNLVDVDAVREDFITEVYRVLDADPTNDRANAIIDAFDSLPTVSQEQPEDVVVVARAFLDVLSKTPYNNKPITDAQVIVRQLLLFFENPKEYNPDAIVEQPKVDLVAKLKRHLATTPKEQLEKEWKELEPWCNIGPTVQEFLYGKQPKVDLEKEIEMYVSEKGVRDYAFLVPSIARHFWKKGYNARKEGQK